jgi:hypothetical protein
MMPDHKDPARADHAIAFLAGATISFLVAMPAVAVLVVKSGGKSI